MFTLAAPQPTPEKIDPAKGEFPYLTGLPGSKLAEGSFESVPCYAQPEGASQEAIVATSYIRKWYQPQDGLSNALFLAAYRAALTEVGWVIVKTSSSADAGARDLARTLSTDCHIALTGVLFDFNKSTLQAASDPVLQQVLGLLGKDASLKVEVQGHTDNVGTDAYNQTLSESRATAVVAWLTQHGVAATRLTSKGYGKTMPVADNASDVGRAKNRRVEIANPRCVAKGK